jgi:hypothetical protein
VWGEPGLTRDILLNGHRFSVTSNLYHALLNLRDSFEVRRMNLHVWIDAICINQQDLGERAAQVKKMDVIYSQCLSVRGFLGHASAKVATALLILRQIVDAMTVGGSCLCQVCWEVVTDIEADDSLWGAMSAISSSPYWERLWIIQEVALAPSVYGMLALLPSEVVARIHPSYDPSCSVSDVFTTFTKSCFQVAGNLNPLARNC